MCTFNLDFFKFIILYNLRISITEFTNTNLLSFAFVGTNFYLPSNFHLVSLLFVFTVYYIYYFVYFPFPFFPIFDEQKINQWKEIPIEYGNGNNRASTLMNMEEPGFTIYIGLSIFYFNF